MKKVLSIFLLILTFIIIYIFQSNFFNWFNIAGVMPNIFVIFILFISLYADLKLGLSFGILSGLFLDIVLGRTLGISAIMLGIVAIIGALFEKNFSKDSKITIILMVMVSTIVFEIGSYILAIAELSINIELMDFIIKLLIEVLYNAILTIILYPLIKKMGYKIENIYKGNMVLTRYF